MEETLTDVSAELDRLERNATVWAEEGFQARVEALDVLETDVLDRIDEIARSDGETEVLQELRWRAYVLRRTLEEANRQLIEKLRESIRSGQGRGEELERRLRAYTGDDADDSLAEEGGYSALDALIGGLFMTAPVPAETRLRTPEMVCYQPTPGRIILDLCRTVHFAAGDAFCDLGSGLGQVAILVHLLTSVKARGVEYESAYCTYARACAGDLGLMEVEFVEGDALESDLSGGTVFYMYTPFTGAVLETVLRRLEAVARFRAIRVLTYGPCTLAVRHEAWLANEQGSRLDAMHLAVFRSVRS